MRHLRSLLALASACLAGGFPHARGPVDGRAFLCAKAITCAQDASDPQVIDDAVLLVSDGRIEAVGRRDQLAIPEGYAVHDTGDAWIVPGLIDLHSHIGHDGYLADWHTAVYLVNPGLRVGCSVEPGNPFMERALSGGVTTLLYIPGSATNMGGQGVLLKCAPDRYEEAVLRDPGALKIAQAGNPENWAVRVDRAFMYWNLRTVMREGVAYAKRWEAFEAGEGPEPPREPRLDVFRELRARRMPIATHTQIYQVVLTSITMLVQEFGFDAFIDHGTFDGFRAAEIAEANGVAAILGPRNVASTYRYRGFAEIDLDGRIEGVAAGYQQRGHTRIGFNTDAMNFVSEGGVWTEDLALQGAMGVRYGMENDRLEVLRGLTIVPAVTVGIEGRVGSLEPDKDADFVVVDGDPTDPRARVREVYVEGELVHDRASTPAMW